MSHDNALDREIGDLLVPLYSHPNLDLSNSHFHFGTRAHVDNAKVLPLQDGGARCNDGIYRIGTTREKSVADADKGVSRMQISLQSIVKFLPSFMCLDVIYEHASASFTNMAFKDNLFLAFEDRNLPIRMIEAGETPKSRHSLKSNWRCLTRPFRPPIPPLPPRDKVTTREYYNKRYKKVDENHRSTVLYADMTNDIFNSD
ncbi:hypothetical protein GJ744_010548 [Endocarpon pusillum]|uniref:Uncharacterized protein n=1 Tax=Endocarpon pusillum TaxID=364733 RepID=A0A8H7ARW5_9EURO|nr:hypothetical protein GJ744_010548 [Endocarpon pusillum]